MSWAPPSSNRRRALRQSSLLPIAAGLLLIGFGLNGCTETGQQQEAPAAAPAETAPAPPPTEPTASPPPAPSAPPEPVEPAVVPLSDSEYQQELSANAKKIRVTLGRVARARSHEGLARRVVRAETSATGAAARLGELVPPEPTGDAHELLVRSLRGLAAGLGTTAQAVRERDLCAASSVLARIGRLPARKPLERATKELEAAGYRVPGFLPEAPPAQTRRLATGDFVFVEARSGFGTLTVENGLGVDGVVVLTRRKTPVTSMYVRRNDFGVIGGIPDGTYRAYFTLGMDWDAGLRRFTRKCSFARFDEPMAFETVHAGSSIQYQTYSVTLHPVAGGTAATSDVSPDSFPG